MDLSNPANAKVISYLTREDNRAPGVVSPATVKDPYYQCGCHPDIVERIWDQLGKDLPRNCRQLICGTPGLIHPKSGVVFVLGLGTQYGLKLSEAFFGEALRLGSRTHVRWSSGGELEITRELGTDWIFGGWHKQEATWVKSMYGWAGGQLPPAKPEA